jgi:hypothetical protein
VLPAKLDKLGMERGIRSTNGAVEFVARLAVIGDAGDVNAMRS